MDLLQVVSAQKPTAVTHCASGALTGEDAVDLVCSMGPFVELRTFVDGKLDNPVLFNCYGRITSVRVYRPVDGPQQSMIFCSLDNAKYAVLALENGSIVERGYGDLKESLAKKTELPSACAADPRARFIAMYLYAGLITVLPLDSRTGLAREPFSVACDEIKVLDICALHSSRPCLAVLYEDGKKKSRNVKTYWLDLKTRELADGPFAQPNVDPTSTKLVAETSGGLLIFAATTVVYLSGQSTPTAPQSRVVSIPVQFGHVQAVCSVDSGRFLVGDEHGYLHVLTLHSSANQVVQLTIDKLGETSTASSLSYLDDGFVFIGSAGGDSQLVRLLPEPAANNASLEIVEAFCNMGAITDMSMVDIDAHGRGQIVTCSGMGKTGSLRVVRNGVGIDVTGEVELAGIKALYALAPSSQSVLHTALVQSFASESRVLGFEGEELTEVEITALSLNEPTLYAGNLANDVCVQATPSQVAFFPASQVLRLPSGQSSAALYKSPKRLTLASSDGSLVLVCEGQGQLVLLNSTAQVVSRASLPHEVACMTFAGQFVVCGLWTDLSLRILVLPSLNQVGQEALEGETLPRSLVVSQLGMRRQHLFVGMGDGSLVLLPWEQGRITGPARKIGLGTLPVELSVFTSPNGQQSVLAACDRPAVVYSSGDKILLSNVNASCDVKHAVAFCSQVVAGSLALAGDSMLVIGTMNEIQKLHVKTVPINDTPRRLAHQPQSQTLCVATMHAVHRDQPDEAKADTETAADVIGRLVLFDDRTFAQLDAFLLDDFEEATCVLSCVFTGEEDGAESRPMYVCGTAFCSDVEEEPNKGRILVLDVVKGDGDERKLNLVSERSVRGAVHSLCSFQGKLVAGINAKVQVYKWSGKGQGELIHECGSHGHTASIMLKAHGNFVVVGDLMKSISLLKYDEARNMLEEVARHYSTSWMAALHVLRNGEMYLGADAFCNLFTVRRDAEADSEEEQSRLVMTGAFHWGDFINVFCAGSLVMPRGSDGAGEEEEEKDLVHAVPELVFGTVSGAVGVLASLTWKEFLLLDRLQQAIVTVKPSRNAEWRAFNSDRKLEPARGFIDGDLIESLLDMSKEQVDQVAEQMNKGLPVPGTAKVLTNEPARVTREGIIGIVEELTRLH